MSWKLKRSGYGSCFQLSAWVFQLNSGILPQVFSTCGGFSSGFTASHHWCGRPRPCFSATRACISSVTDLTILHGARFKRMMTCDLYSCCTVHPTKLRVKVQQTLTVAATQFELKYYTLACHGIYTRIMFGRAQRSLSVGNGMNGQDSWGRKA